MLSNDSRFKVTIKEDSTITLEKPEAPARFHLRWGAIALSLIIITTISLLNFFPARSVHSSYSDNPHHLSPSTTTEHLQAATQSFLKQKTEEPPETIAITKELQEEAEQSDSQLRTNATTEPFEKHNKTEKQTEANVAPPSDELFQYVEQQFDMREEHEKAETQPVKASENRIQRKKSEPAKKSTSKKQAESKSKTTETTRKRANVTNREGNYQTLEKSLDINNL